MDKNKVEITKLRKQLRETKDASEYRRIIATIGGLSGSSAAKKRAGSLGGLARAKQRRIKR